MAGIDARVASLLDRKPDPSEEEDEDALIAALEEDDNDDHVIDAFREQRLQQLHSEFSRARSQREYGFGTYTELKDEKAVMDSTTSTKLSLVHFMKPDFTRCRVMDQKLEALAPKHFDTRFISVNVENAPFLVGKLNIKVLPCVVAYVNGLEVDRIIGFEAIGAKPDSFTLQELETRLLGSGVLLRSKMTDDDEEAARGRRLQQVEDEEGEDDWE